MDLRKLDALVAEHYGEGSTMDSVLSSLKRMGYKVSYVQERANGVAMRHITLYKPEEDLEKDIYFANESVEVALKLAALEAKGVEVPTE